MKKIINNKVYDTATAKKLASYDSGNWGDLDHFCETLYRKKTGEYFLHGEGGSMTRYAKPSGSNTWAGGERIMPMGFEDARAWAEEHLGADEYGAIFGAVVEDDTRKVVTYSLSVTAIEKLKRAVSESGRTASDIIEELINNMGA